MSHQPTGVLFPKHTTRQVLGGLAALSLILGFWIANHRWAYRAGEPLGRLAWVHPVLPDPLYVAGIGVSLLLAVLALRRGRYLAASGTVLSGLFFAQLLWGPVFPPTLLLRALRLAWQTPGPAPGLTPSILEGLLAAGVVFITGATIFVFRQGSQERPDIAHGSSRPATYRELKKLGMLGAHDGAVRLGAFAHAGRRIPLTDSSDHHVLMLMPSGAGKTSGPLVSSLLTNLDSAVVLDPKREIFQLTAGWRRSRGHRVLYFSPSSTATLRWNPLAEITPGEQELAEIQILADNLVTYPASHREDHWTSAARDLFRLLSLHTLYTQDPPTLTDVRTLLSWPAGYADLFDRLQEHPHDPDGRRRWKDPATGEPTLTHPEVLILARRFAETPQRELGSIVSTLQTFLSLWGNPVIQTTTSGLDFSVDDLLTPEPITLYVALPYGDLRPLAPLLRVFLALLTRRLTRDPEFTDAGAGGDRPRVNFFLDEFASLGRVPILEDMLAFFRGYGIRALMAVQDLPQLHRLYGIHESITGNCQIHVCAATLSSSTRQHASKLSGEATVRYQRRSVSGSRGSWIKKTTTVTPAEVKRQLLTEGEVGTLPPDRLLIYKTGAHPILAEKSPYWRNPELLARSEISPPEPPASQGPWASDVPFALAGATVSLATRQRHRTPRSRSTETQQPHEDRTLP